MATSTAHAFETVKEEHKPKVDVKQTRTQKLRQKHGYKSTPDFSDNETQKSNKKISALETSKSQIKSKSAIQLTSTSTVIGQSGCKEKDKGDSSGVNKRKTTKTVTIKDSLSPRIKRREIVSESESSPKDSSSPRIKRREIVSESESSPKDSSSPRIKQREIVSESESSPKDSSSPRIKRKQIVSESESSPKALSSPRIKRKEIVSDFKSSPMQSPRAGAKTVQKAHSHDAIQTHLTLSHSPRPVKHGPLSSMSHLSDSRSSVHSDMSVDSFISGSASGSGSKSSSNLSASELFDRRYAMKLTYNNLRDTSKTICAPAQIVTDRLYTPINVNEKRDFLRRKQWQLPSPQRRSRKDHQSPKKKRLSVIKASSTDDIQDSYHVYDWLNRSVHSDTDLTTTLSLTKRLEKNARRRHSDPLGCKNGPCFVEYDHDIDDGFRRDGVRFLREYFTKDLVWLSNQIDLFLSSINLSPVYPSVTNEEWYLTVTRPTVFKPKTQENLYDVSAGINKAEVDVVDAVKDVAEIRGAGGIMKMMAEESIPQMVDAWTVTWQQVIMCDVSTNTPRPRTCSKTTLTDPAYRDQQTSTDDITFRMKREQSTSTADMYDLHIGSPTHRASPISAVDGIEDDVESSAYGSYESGNLRKQLYDRGSTEDKSDSELSLHLGGEGNIGKTKPKLTQEDTNRIQSELNRLARERIEIIELFVLNVGNMSSSFTEELLEAKLNYSIGQTDSLLALLEDAWNFEDAATSTPRDNGVCKINHEIIEQSRSELEYSKKVIKLCINEVKEINSDGSKHVNILEEIMKMKRKAEIEAFKLERMWEQLLYERSKKQKHLSNIRNGSSSHVGPGSTTFKNLRNRGISATSPEDAPKQRTTSTSTEPTSEMQRDISINDSVDSYLAVPGHITPKAHKDHLVELRRLLISEHDHSPRTSRSRSSYTGHAGRMTSSVRLSHIIYPSNRAYYSYSTRALHSPDRYRLTSDAYRSNPWSTYRDPVPTTSSYDKYKPYTGRYQTTIK